MGCQVLDLRIGIGLLLDVDIWSCGVRFVILHFKCEL